MGTRKLRRSRKLRKLRGGQDEIEPRFGVELEICIKLDKTCIGEDPQFTPRALNTSRPKMGVEGQYYSEVRIQWLDKFLKYAEHYIKGNPITPKMYEKYEYVYVKGWGKYTVDYIYDLSDFSLKPYKGRVDYTKPFFNQDALYCGDSKSYDAEKNPELANTFNMEFITPILSSIDELKDLLEFIGLEKKGCFLTNQSTGYHVNVSLFNKTTGKPVILDKQYFVNHFYPRFKKWEIESYPKIRSEKTNFAKPLSNVANNVVYNTAKGDKYYTVYIKDDDLYEIRAFGASSDIPTLLEYTTNAIQLIEEPYKEYMSTGVWDVGSTN